MHIHPSSPNSSEALPEEVAATKIQAGFRGYRVRKQLKHDTNDKDNSSDESEKFSSNNNENVNSNNKQLNYKTPKTNVEEQSATKIQANVRGFLVRKKQKLASEAATKIQASFRGFKVRKDIKKKKVSN